MITLKNIYLENFMSVSNLSLEFEDDTVISISGQNGSGKSTLIYAIAFAITGYRKGDSYRDYVMTGKDYAKVILNATLDGYPIYYEIDVKSNNKTGNPVKKKVVYKDVEYLNSDYNKFMKDHELEYIENLMFLFQGNDDIIESKPSERAATLKYLFQLDFDYAVDSLKEKQEILKNKLIENNAVLKSLENKSYERQALKREFLPSIVNEWSKELEDINKSLEQTNDIDSFSFRQLDLSISNMKKDISVTDAKLKSFSDKKDIYEKQLEEIKRNIEIDKNKYEDIDNDIEALNEVIKNNYDNLKSLNDNLNEDLHKFKVFEYEENQLKSQIKISESGICHACGQPIGKSHVDSLKNILDKKNIEVEELRKLINNKKEDINNIKEKIKFDEKSLKSMIDFKSYYESLSSQKNSIINNLSSLNETIESQKSYLSILNQNLEKALKEKETYDNLLPLIDKREELLEKKNDLTLKLKTNEDIINYNNRAKIANQYIEREEKENEEQKKELSINQNNLTIDLSSIKTSTDIFENLFPNYVVLQACKQLEDYINSIVQRLFPYMKVSLKQNRSGVNFYYTAESSDEELSVCMASGAQKMILSLAYNVALARMYGLNCILIDEADASMTPENAKLVYDFIASLDDFSQIIFISHRKESREAIKNSKRENIIFYEVNNGEYNLV